MSARTFLAFLAVCAVIGLLAFGLLSKGTAKIAVGDPVPDRALPVLGGSGEGKIADYRGEWVLVNLWASWCLPCRDEAPELERWYREHRGHGVTVLGINVQDNSEDALAFLDEFETDLPAAALGRRRAQRSLRLDRRARELPRRPEGEAGADLARPGRRAASSKSSVDPIVEGS